MTATITKPTNPRDDAGRPFTELRTHGLLWLINRQVLHPRGFALAVIYEPDKPDLVGWDLLGDGREPINFADGDETPALAAVEQLFALRRAQPIPMGSGDTPAALAVRDLEQLPHGAVVVDENDDVHQLARDNGSPDAYGDWGYMAEGGIAVSTHEQLLTEHPGIRIIHIPETRS